MQKVRDRYRWSRLDDRARASFGEDSEFFFKGETERAQSRGLFVKSSRAEDMHAKIKEDERANICALK